MKFTANHVPGEHNLLGHFIKLGGANGRQWVVLAVDGAAIEAHVDFREGQRGRRGDAGVVDVA